MGQVAHHVLHLVHGLVVDQRNQNFFPDHAEENRVVDLDYERHQLFEVALEASEILVLLLVLKELFVVHARLERRDLVLEAAEFKFGDAWLLELARPEGDPLVSPFSVRFLGGGYATHSAPSNGAPCELAKVGDELFFDSLRWAREWLTAVEPVFSHGAHRFQIEKLLFRLGKDIGQDLVKLLHFILHSCEVPFI